MYKIEFTLDASNSLRKLDRNTQLRISGILDRIKTNPYSFAKKLKSTLYFRFRAGDYRIISEIKDDKMIILVIDIGHRKNIYKKLKQNY